MDDVNLSGDEQAFISDEQSRLTDENAIASLTIENCGPITKTRISVKKLTLIIGKNNTGKSIVAKLITIFEDLTTYSLDKDEFIKKLSESDISIFIEEKTKISWVSSFGRILFGRESFYSNLDIDGFDESGLKLYSNIMNLFEMEGDIKKTLERVEKSKGKKIKAKKANVNYLKKALEQLEKIKGVTPDIKDRFETFYIPAEREFVSVISGAVFSALKNQLPISKPILNFASKFEQSRSEKNKMNINFLNVSFLRENNEDRIYLPNDQYIPISMASSGIKSVVPALVVLSAIENRRSSFVAFEEPENNLHPTAQKSFVNLIARFCLKGEVQILTVTTHSPYILSSFNNLIQAGVLASEKPDLADEIAKIIPKDFWIDFEDVNAYMLEDGSAKPILDKEWKGIAAEEIDKASDEIGDEYERLLELKYRNNKND